MTTYWCELAVVDGAVHDSVVAQIEGERITSVEAGAPRPDGSVALRGLTIPGVANAHSHAFHRALRSRTQRDGGSFWTWRDVMYRVADRLDPDSYFLLARATFAEMVMAGVTSVGEFHYVHHGPGGIPYDEPNAMGEALIAAATDAGVRITLLDTLYLHGGLDGDGHTPAGSIQQRYSDGSADSWADRVDRLPAGPNHRIGAAIHSVRAVDERSMRAAVEWASAADAPLHAHVSEQRAENEQCEAHYGRTPTELLESTGALDQRFCSVHATHLTRGDIDAMSRPTACVCMCPTTERDLGDGIGPSTELVAADVPICLGSDSHAVIDMFEEARAVELDERLRSERRGRHQADELLRAATATGHHALGWDDAGAIAVGQRADLVAVALDSVRTAGSSADVAIEAVVFAASAADVTDVVSDGRHIVTDGRHRSLDVARELETSIGKVLGHG